MRGAFIDTVVNSTERAQELGKKLVREHGVVFREHAAELFTLFFHQLHGVVHHFAKAVQLAAGAGGQLGGGDVLGKGRTAATGSRTDSGAYG